MAHEAGNTTLPLPAGKSESTGATWIEKLAEGIGLTLDRMCGSAWASLAPGEPLIKTRIPRNPYKYRFTAVQLAGLFLWADRTSPSTVERLGQEITVRNIELLMLWIPPPSQWDKAEDWSNFWVAIDAATELAINTEFSPWTTATANGQSLLDAASLWSLRLGAGGPTEITLSGHERPIEAYQWNLSAQLRVSFDQAAQPAPVSPNRVENNYEQSETFVLTSRLRQADWQ